MPPKKSQRQMTLPEVMADGIKRRTAVTAAKHIVADTTSSSTELEEEGNMREQQTTSAQAVDNSGGFDSDEEIVANGPNEVIVFPVTFEEFQQYTNCAVRVKQIIKEMWRTHKRLMEQEQQMCADMEGKWLQLMYERFYTHPLYMRERANLKLKKCSAQMRKKLLARATIKVLTPKTNEDNGSKRKRKSVAKTLYSWTLRSIENATVKPVRKKRKRIVQEHSSSSESDTGGLCLSRRKMRATIVDSCSGEPQLSADAEATQHQQMSVLHEYVLSDTEEFNPIEVRSDRAASEERVAVESVEKVCGDNFTVNLLQFITEPNLISSSAQFPVSFQTFTNCSRQTEIVGNLLNALKSEHGIDLSKDEMLKERIFKNYYLQFYTNPSIRKKFPMIFMPCPTCVKKKVLRMPQENAAMTTLSSDSNQNVPALAAPSTEQCMLQREPVGDSPSDNQLKSPNQSRGVNTQFLHKSIDQQFISNYIQARGGKNLEMLTVIYERLKREVLHSPSDEKPHEKEKVQILSVEKLCGPCPKIAPQAATSTPATEGPMQTVANVEYAKKLLSHKVNKLHTMPYLLRYYDGMKRIILSAIMQMTIEEFQRYTHVYGAPDIYSDIEALRYCYTVALVEPGVWPVHLCMHLVDMHQYLQSKQVEYVQLDLQHVSPKLLHWEELVATTDFDECVRFDYYKCTGETLSSEELLCERRESFYRRCWAHDQWLWQTPIVNEITLEQFKATTMPDLGNQQEAADMHESTTSSGVTLLELSYVAGDETENDEGALSVDMEADAVVEECAVVEQSAGEAAHINNANSMLVDIPNSTTVGEHNQEPEDELEHVATPELLNASEHMQILFQRSDAHSTLVPGTERPHFAVVDMPNTQAQIEALPADGINTSSATITPTEEDRLAMHPSPMRKTPAAEQSPVTSPKEAILPEFCTSAAVVKQELLPLKGLQFNLLNDEDHFECQPAADDLIVIESESLTTCTFDELSPCIPIVSPTDLSGHQLQSRFSFGCSSGSMTEGQQLPSCLEISLQQQTQIQEGAAIAEHTHKQQMETENRAAATQMHGSVITHQQQQLLKKPQEKNEAQTLQKQELNKILNKTQQEEKQNSLNDAQQKVLQPSERKKEQREQQQLQQQQPKEQMQQQNKQQRQKEQMQQQKKEQPQTEQQEQEKDRQKQQKEKPQQEKEQHQQQKEKRQQQEKEQHQQQKEQRQHNQQQHQQSKEPLQQPKERLQQQQKQQRQKEQQQQQKGQQQQEKEEQQKQKGKRQQKQNEQQQQPKERLQQQQKQQLQLQQQQKQRLQLQGEQQKRPKRLPQQQSGAMKQSSKSVAVVPPTRSKIIAMRNATAPAKPKHKVVDAIVPQLTHEFRALQLLSGSEITKAPDVVAQPMVRIARASYAAISSNVQGFGNDTSLFNNTNLLRMVDQSKPQSQQQLQHQQQPQQPAQQLHKQVNYKTNAVDSTSGRHQNMVYRKLELFDYFGQLTVDHIERYQLHSTGIGQPYMRARTKCADGRRTFLYGDVLGALFARCPAPLLRDMHRLLEELGEYHYTARKSANASRHAKAGCEDLRASVLGQFMRSAPVFTYAHLRPDCDLWQRVEPVGPVTDETLTRQPHCGDLSAALSASTLARIAEFKSKNRAPL